MIQSRNTILLLEKIAKKVHDEILYFNNPGLHGGVGGLALFLAYYAKFTDEQKYLDRAVEAIQFSMESFIQEAPVFTLAGGWAGMGWTLAHFQQEGFMDVDINELFEDIHPFMEKTVRKNIDAGIYDFLHGGIGIGHYYLENKTAPNRDEILQYIAQKLQELSYQNNEFQPLQEQVFHERPAFTYNLGIAHGIPGILAFLALLQQHGFYTAKTTICLKAGAAWMLQQKLEKKETSVFPKKMIAGKPQGMPSFLGWCYGDLSVSSALYQVGNLLSDTYIVDQSLVVAQLGAFRSKGLSGVDNPYFCHGSAGVAYIFKQFADKTDSFFYKKAADFWLQETIEYFDTEEYVDFFDRELENLERSLLAGVAGIGMVLMAFLKEDKGEWKRAFLL